MDIKKIVIPAVLTFVVNFFMQILTNTLWSETKGEVISTDVLKIDTSNYLQTVIISNFQKTSLRDLQFFTETGIITDIQSKLPIEISKTSERGFVISEIYPKTTLTLQVSLRDKAIEVNKRLFVQPLNYLDKSLDYKQSSELDQQSRVHWINLLVNSFAAAIIYSIFFYMALRRIEQHDLKVRELKEKVYEAKNEAMQQTEKLKSDLIQATNKQKEITNIFAKLKLLLLRKSSDLQKENRYYKALLSSLIKNSNVLIDEKLLQDEVRKQLKTYTTVDLENDFDAMDIIGHILKEKDRKNC